MTSQIIMRDARGTPLTAEDGERVLRGSCRRSPRPPRAAYVLSTLLALVAARCDPRLPARALANFIAVIVVGSGLVWLKGAMPGILHDAPLAALAGTGLTMTCTHEIGPPAL